MTMKVEIFTDGACRGNPGVGGWGAILRSNGKEKRLKGSEQMTTNNRMELTAALCALESLKHPCVVDLTTDSQYLRKGMLEWMDGWKKRGWRNSKKEPVKNKDLWQRLDAIVKEHTISWHWVKGHSGHAENELADMLANEAIDELLQEL